MTDPLTDAMTRALMQQITDACAKSGGVCARRGDGMLRVDATFDPDAAIRAILAVAREWPVTNPTPANGIELKPRPKIASSYAVVDITMGRKALAKYLKANAGLPVVIHAVLTCPYGSDDGTSLGFNAAVLKIEAPA